MAAAWPVPILFGAVRSRPSCGRGRPLPTLRSDPVPAPHVSLFDLFRSGHAPPAIAPSALLGCWRLARADAHLDLGEQARLEFRPGNDLRCTFVSKGKVRELQLAYWLEGDTLVTDQASAPREQRLQVHLESPTVLRLNYGGALAWFERTDCDTPGL